MFTVIVWWKPLYHGLLVALLVVGLAGCAGEATLPPEMSRWGEVLTLGEAEQSTASAFTVDANRLTAFWVGADETGVHQDMRIILSGQLTERTVLPLPPEHPYGQQTAPASPGNTHLLWLDAGEDNLPRLFEAVLTPEMTVERGPLEVSDRRTLHFTHLPAEDSGLQVVWSGGTPAEPHLFFQEIDSAGRPKRPQPLGVSGDWPLLTAVDGKTVLFWLNRAEEQIYSGELLPGVLLAQRSVVALPELTPGDRLLAMQVGADQTHAYLFWTITRLAGGTETWYASGLLTGGDWSSPARLGFTALETPFTTGFNSGTAQGASSGVTWVAWVSPAQTQYAVLPVAAGWGKRLVVLYFQAGQVVGWQDIAGTNGLIGSPLLIADRDLHLYLAWADPQPTGSAALKITMTRQGG
ncbi:MAG: hypothetical protein H6672_04395 [Anaerolineaceae bacterium]|nr:hypothetical protein [Anaerolineaceae bacterium]